MASYHVFTRAVLAASLVLAPSVAEAQLIHSYDFNSGLTDTVPGGASLIQSSRGSAVGTVGGGVYTFQQGAGLGLLSQLPGNDYTIDLRVNLTQLGGYRKLVSFNNLADDAGLYFLNGSLVLYNVTGATSSSISAGSFNDVRLTRTTGGLITGYVNGVQALSYQDTSNFFTATSALYFLRDDTRQDAEDSAGIADYIRIYDDAMGGVIAAVPEADTWAMMLVGVGMAGMTARARRRRGARTFAAA